MTTAPNPDQQRTIDVIAETVHAQPGELTLSTTEAIGQLDITIQSPNQPVRLTLNPRGELTELAFWDSMEENCEPDGSTTQGRWIDVEEDSEIGLTLRTATKTTSPAPTARDLLDKITKEILGLRDAAGSQPQESSAAAYEKAANMIREASEQLPSEPSDGTTPNADPMPPFFAENRLMLGLPELPWNSWVTTHTPVVDDLAERFHQLRPELDAHGCAKPWKAVSNQVRAGHRRNAQRILDAIANGRDLADVPFIAVPVTPAHIHAALRAYNSQQPKAA